MVDSIRHWCRVAGLIIENSGRRGHFVPTELGETIFDDQKGFDAYLDDPATLWLIHYQIATNANQATAWYWAFNISRGNYFTPNVFKRELYEWAQREYTRGQEKKKKLRPISDNTLQRDVNCFIRTYCSSHHSDGVVEETFDCPLVELNLIAELSEGNGYEFQRGAKETLPIEVVAWALDKFWESDFSRSNTLSFSKLMSDPLSPGRVFRLDEDTMTMHLEDLRKLTNGALEYEESTGLKQVRRHKDLNRMEFLNRYYG